MFEDTVTQVGDRLASLTAALIPDTLPADTVTSVYTGLDRIERLAWAGKTLLAPTVAAGHAGQAGGGRTGTDALARHAGTGSGAARDQLATGHALDGLPALAAALRGGHLSATQAILIAAAATADPAAEHRLLALAPQLSVAELRAECARVRAAADPDPDATHRRLRAARRLRRYTDGEGGWNLTARGTPADGAAFNAVLDPLIDAVFRAARAAGEHAPFEAHAFDALMALADLAAYHPGDPGGPGNPGDPRHPAHTDDGDPGDRGEPDMHSGPGRTGGRDPVSATADTMPMTSDLEPELDPVQSPEADVPAADAPAADAPAADAPAADAPAAHPPVQPRRPTGTDEANDDDGTPAVEEPDHEPVLPLAAEPPPDGPGEPAATSAPRSPTPAPDSTGAEASPVREAEPSSAAPPRPANPPPRRRRSDPRYLALLRVDLTALHRGRVTGDELCEIAGVGPIPVSVARDLLGDAVLKLVLTRGVDVAHITHLGRGPTAAQRIALAWTSPQCSALGCSRTHVQIDHRLDWAHTRHTRLDELDPLCGYHHDLKTRHGWALTPGTGRRAFVPPHHPRHPRHGRDDPQPTPGLPEEPDPSARH